MLRVGIGGLGMISLGGSIPAFMSKFAFADEVAGSKISGDNILVVIQLPAKRRAQHRDSVEG
jgi:hypothetical protein